MGCATSKTNRTREADINPEPSLSAAQEQTQGCEPSLEEGLSWVEFLWSQSPSTYASKSDALSREEQACRGLGKLAAQDAETRDRVLSWGTLDVLLQVLSESCGEGGGEPENNVCQGATWAVVQLCRGEPSVKLENIEAAIPVLVSLLNHTDEAVRVEAAWGLSCIGDCGGTRTARILAYRPIPLLVALLESNAPLPAAKTIGDFVAGSDEMTQAVIDAGALPKFRSLLCHPEEAVPKVVCCLLGNVLAGTVAAQIQAVIDAELVPSLLGSLQADEARTVRSEAVRASKHLIKYGTEEQRKYFLSIGGLVSLCKVIISAEQEAEGKEETEFVELAQTAAGLCLQKLGCCAGDVDATLMKYLGPSLSKGMIEKVSDKVRRSTAGAWYNCGVRIPEAGNVVVADESYSEQQCYIRTLEIDPLYSRAWNNLACTLSASESVAVRGESYSEQQCYTRALEIDAEYFRAWCNLGRTLSTRGSVDVRGESYSKQQCYIRTLEIDPLYSRGWNELATAPPEDIRVKGRFYTKRQCLLLSLSLGLLRPELGARRADKRIAQLEKLS